MSASWRDFESQEPEYAAWVKARFERYGLGLLATLAADGSPRISGLEPIFFGDDLWLGLMPNSVKGADLHRDGRFALHSATIDKDVSEGDAKIHGVALPVEDHLAAAAPPAAEGADLFRVSLVRVASVQVDVDRLVIKSWRPGRPLLTRYRR